jgi:hypothetical protein
MRETKRKKDNKQKKDNKRNTKKQNKTSIIKLEHGTRFSKKNGWIRIKIHGNAFERGFAHGYLLAKELQEIKDAFAFILEVNGYFRNVTNYETFCREKITPSIQTDFPEFFEEIQGISAGAIAAGFPTISFDFIVGWNALLSTYTIVPERCSAFISIHKGNIVMAHNTHTDLLTGQMANVIMEICPSNGHRILMQTSPGWICSGTDFFIIENGIIGCESTIGNINYTPEFGAPYFCRIRQAMQYGNSLDDYVKIMLKNNAGDYPCTWFLGDTKKKEIMQLEIAKETHAVERKTEGVFYGINSAHDETIRKTETTDKTYGNTKTTSGARNMRLHYLLYEKYAGKMTLENAKKIISDHYDVYLDKETQGNNRTICKHSHLDPKKRRRGSYYPFGCTDGKIVDTKMATNMSFIGRFGSSCGIAFNVKTYIEKHPKYKRWEKYLKSMPSQPWTQLL